MILILPSARAYESPAPSIQEAAAPTSQKNYFPMLTLGVPVPISIGLNYLLSPHFSAMVAAGHAPIPFLLNGALAAGHVEFIGRWHPFKGVFFVWASLGYQSITYTTSLNLGTLSVDSNPVRATLALNSIYFALGPGFLWRPASKFFLGFDLGVQIPIIPMGGISVPGDSTAGDSLERSATDAMSHFAGYALPRIALVRAGWIF